MAIERRRTETMRDFTVQTGSAPVSSRGCRGDAGCAPFLAMAMCGCRDQWGVGIEARTTARFDFRTFGLTSGAPTFGVAYPVRVSGLNP